MFYDLFGTMSLRADSRFLIDGVAYYSPAWTPWEGLMLNETRAFYAGKGQPVASYEMKKDKDGNASGAVAIASYITSVTSETARQGGGTMVIGPEFFAGSSSAPTKLFAELSAPETAGVSFFAASTGVTLGTATAGENLFHELAIKIENKISNDHNKPGAK